MGHSPEGLPPLQAEHHEVARSFGDDVFNTAQFIVRYRAMYPSRVRGSMLPSDYCLNRDNKGNVNHPRFLEWNLRDGYRFVGLHPKAPVASKFLPRVHCVPRRW